MNYLSVVLKGEKGNPQGFGAKLKIETDDGILFRECTPYRGFLSSVDQVIHFGILVQMLQFNLELTTLSQHHILLQE